MPTTPNIDEGSGFRGLTNGANIRKPMQDRGAEQPGAGHHEWLSEMNPGLVADLDKIMPGFKNYRTAQLEQHDPNPTGPPNRGLPTVEPGQDVQDNPGVNLRDQFQENATEALGATATGPEMANRPKTARSFPRARFYGR